MMAVLLLVSILADSLVSSGTNLQSQIIGKWIGVKAGEICEFCDNGRFKMTDPKSQAEIGGTYRFIDENHIIMKWRILICPPIIPTTDTYEVLIKDDQLTLIHSGGGSLIFRRA